MARRAASVLAAITFIAGLSFMLYPTVSNYLNTVKQRRAINSYVESASAVPEKDYTKLLQAAKDFNGRLSDSGRAIQKLSDSMYDEYYSLLDISGNGILGYIEISKSDITLPIYHGTRESALQAGAGHYEGSSFPIEGNTVHAVISGHRGLPGSMLFTDLDKLEAGDCFTVYVLNRTYVYRVTGVETVLPEDVGRLKRVRGRNLCTLVTCTPYGINSHRLLVHAVMLGSREAEEHLALEPSSDIVPWYVIVLIFEVPVFIISLIAAARGNRKLPEEVNANESSKS